MIKATWKIKSKKRRAKRYLDKVRKLRFTSIIEKYAELGVAALSAATPVRTGETSESWYYDIEDLGDGQSRINWKNRNVHDGVNVALLIRYGHGTGTGGWVEGRNYVDPAIRPVMDELAEACWNEVKRI